MKYKWLLTDEEYDAINPPPWNIVQGDDGKIYCEYLNDEKFMFMGYIPTPKNRVQWFFHHIMHGLMMGYPIVKVIMFALDKENDGATYVAPGHDDT